MRVLGVDVLTLGSDRPYGQPVRRLLGEAATHAVRVTNPNRLITHHATTPEAPSWARAS